jgi:hypothetical protein
MVFDRLIYQCDLCGEDAQTRKSTCRRRSGNSIRGPYRPTAIRLAHVLNPFRLLAFTDADKNMTNGQMWQTYGRTIGDYVAPPDAVA